MRERVEDAHKLGLSSNSLQWQWKRGWHLDFTNKQSALMRTRRILIISVLILFIFSSFAWSQIYKWKDEKGVVHFSDSPPAGKDVQEIRIREKGAGSETSKDAGRPPNRQAKEKRSFQEIKVIMYMTTWCPYCRKAREYLNSLGVGLVEYNVEKDRDKAEEAKRKGGGGGGVPVIDVEGIIIKGYSPELIKEAVEKRRDL
jgi:glutaredoxin